MKARHGFSGWRVYLPVAAVLLLAGLYSRMLGHVWLVEDYQAVAACMWRTEKERGAAGAGWEVEAGAGASGSARREAAGGAGAPMYRPVAAVNYRLSAQLSRWMPEVLAHRLVNLVLVLAVGLLVVGWLAWFVGPLAAWLVGFVFLAHPAQGQNVFMISARPTLLATAAVLAFLILQRRAVQRRNWSLAGGATAFLVALAGVGADGTGLLVIPLGLAQMALGPTLGKSPAWKSPPLSQQEQRSLRRMHGRTVVMLALVLGLYVLGRSLTVGWHWPDLAPEDDLTGNPLWGLGWWQRLPVSVSLAGLYVKEILKPAQPWSMAPPLLMGWSSGQVWLGLAVLLAGLGMLGWWGYRRHWLVVAGLLAMGQYVLVGHILVPSTLYAATFLVTPFLVAGVAVLAAAIHELVGTSTRRRAVMVAAALVVMAAMSWRVWQSGREAVNILELRRAELEAQPLNPVAMFRYGQALYELGRFEDALYWLENVVDRRPRSIQARRALADLLLILGRPAAAYRHYQVIVRLHPDDRQARQRLEQLGPVSPGPEPGGTWPLTRPESPPS